MPASTDKERRKPKARPRGEQGDGAHEEWRIDEALQETFPASDPPSPVQPHGDDDETKKAG